MIELKRASRIVREAKAEERKSELVEDLTVGQAQLLHGEFQDRASEIADDSVHFLHRCGSILIGCGRSRHGTLGVMELRGTFGSRMGGSLS